MIEFLKGTVTPKDWMAVGIIIAAMLALIVLFVFIVHASQKDKLAKLEQQDADLIHNIQRARELERDIEKVRTDTEKFQLLVRQFERRLPYEHEIPSLMRDFEDLANDVGIRSSVDSQARRAEAKKETIPYKVTARGDFHQIASFINRLERFKRFVKISDIEIALEGGKQEQAEDQAKATFTLSTFRFIQSAAEDAS